MDFFQEIVRDKLVKEYLKDFPESDWKAVVKKTLLYGIHSLKALENLGLASPKIENIPALQFELAEMKKNLAGIETTLSNNFREVREKKKADSTKENSKNPQNPRGCSQKNVREKVQNYSSGMLRGSSKDRIKQPPFRLTGKEKPEVRRKLPKYLINVDSKIRDDVQKSKKGVLVSQNRTEKRNEDQTFRWEEWKTSEFSAGKIETHDSHHYSPRSSSSFSTYNAGDDIKEFYQKEFSNLLPIHTNDEKRKSINKENSRKPLKAFSRSSSNSDT